jgi:hypothetical protein
MPFQHPTNQKNALIWVLCYNFARSRTNLPKKEFHEVITTIPETLPMAGITGPITGCH